ncbi:MAG: ABC transporter ATP-binding protein [Clostridia bacterium]
MNQEVLVACGLSKTYGKGDASVAALRPTDLSIRAGEFTAIIGPSGSGKSTLLHILGGLDTPTTGSVQISGQELFQMSDDHLSAFRRRHIGFVFQAFHLIPTMTAKQNILLPVLLDKARVDQTHYSMLIDMLGISDRLDHLPSELSGGQMQRIALARALIMKPDIIFADEPTGNLDVESGNLVMKLLQDITAANSGTLVVITHNPGLAKMARRVLTIIDGTVNEG